MTNLKNIILDVFVLSLICTSLIGAMNNQTNINDGENDANKGFRDCIIEMEGVFGSGLDEPARNYVKKAIKDFHISQLVKMHVDVEEYYVSFPQKLAADTLFIPARFCTEFTSNQSKLKELEDNIKKRADETGDDTDTKKYLSYKSSEIFIKWADCIHELSLTRRREITLDEILTEALYNRRLSTHNDNVQIIHKHNPTTYEYFYLEDIAERVCIIEGFLNPHQFCFKKYLSTEEDQSISVR